MAKKTCIYCGTAVYKDNRICTNCEEKLKLIRRILALGVEIKLQAGREKTKV